jgi:hypothetical protein
LQLVTTTTTTWGWLADWLALLPPQLLLLLGLLNKICLSQKLINSLVLLLLI